MAEAGPSGLTSILKSKSAYDDEQAADEQFFPSESLPASETASFDEQQRQQQDRDARQDQDYGDPTGSVFSGPTAEFVPSSVSTFRLRARSKSDLDKLSRSYGRSMDDESDRDDDEDDRKSYRSRRSSRRRRRKSLSSSRGGVSDGATTDATSGNESDDAVSTTSSRRDGRSRRGRRRRRPSTSSSSSEGRTGFFEGIANAFRGRRPSMSREYSDISERSAGRRSRRSRREVDDADEEEEDRDDAQSTAETEDPYGYGPYGESDSTASTSSNGSSSSHDDNAPRRRRNAASGLIPGTGDQFFGGDSRFDIETSDDEISSMGSVDSRGKPIPNAYQSIYIPDEDLPLRFDGLSTSAARRVLWAALCILSCGILWLVARWLPRIWLKLVSRPGEFDKASLIVVETAYHEPTLLEVKTMTLPKPMPVLTIFPPSMAPPFAHREDFVEAAQGHQDDANSSHISLSRGTTPFGSENGAAFKKKSKHQTIQKIRYVDYRYYRFVLHPDGEFRMVREWKDSTWRTVPALRRGLTDVDATIRKTLFGPNMIEVASRGIVTILIDEVLHPFYVFQIFSILLWSIDDYYYYAFAIAVISVGSIITTLIETRKNIERMREMSRFSCQVRVHRDHEWVMLDSSELALGDLVDLSEDSLNSFPADFLLLSGDAIVNESMLTGESIPVSKVPVEERNVELVQSAGGEIPGDLSRHVVFCGTKIVRIRKTAPVGFATGEPEAVGMVLRTGFNTTKGALVRSMLFPKPFGFAFYRDSFRFIGVLAMVAVAGFLASSVNFVELGIHWSVIVIRALDLVTIVVPPALPATMSIGTSFAIARLKKLDIFCISPNRVNIGGKVNVVCFDKTGTLTEEGLDVLGVRTVARSSNSFSELQDDPDSIPIYGAADAKTPLLHALATCHSLKIVDGEAIGDPLDLKMFDFTKWTLEEGREGVRPAKEPKSHKKGSSSANNASSKVPERAATLVQMVVRPPGGEGFKLEDALKAGSKHAHFLELGVLRTFEFQSSLRRMSVLVKKLKSTSIEAYVKGAPEVMIDICDKSTLPADYEEVLSNYTKHGYRVIALAGKSFAGLTWVKAQRLKREAVESDLRFLGLIVFENKLKAGTTSGINTLRNAHIPTRMVTGDNVRTAISVARECGMISQTSRVYLPAFLKGEASSPKAILEWTDVDNETRRLDSFTLKPEEPDTYSLLSDYSVQHREYHLAVTGDVFRWMLDYGPVETLHRMLLKGVVFARMSPDEKHELVERLQSMDYVVGFCGDGANDCGALKAADVGLSLSEAEASVAAPFTSRQPDIRCFIDVIKEGRAALVTSFSCFKFMALYSLIQFTTVTLLYAIAGTLGDFQFLYIDLFLILPIAVTMGRTEPFPRIVPKRPTANLVSKKVLTSLIGQIMISSGLQIAVFFYTRAQPWYMPPDIDPDELDIVSYENTALFLLSSFQYIIVAIVFCVGPPYRKSLYTNRALVVVLAVLIAFSVYTLLVTHGPIFLLLELISLPHEFHLEMLLIVIANMAMSALFEEYGAMKLARFIGDTAKRIRRWRGKRREEGKMYKSVARDMED